MGECKFKVGDKVVCIIGFSPFLKYGEHYTVEHTSGDTSDEDRDWVCLSGVRGEWCSSRFKLFVEPKEQAEPVPQKQAISHAQYIRSCVDALNKAVTEAQQQGLDVCVDVEDNKVDVNVSVTIPL